MVDLPSIPLATPQVRAPTSPVSPGDIAAPYREFGDALDKIAGTADQVAVQAAHEAAQTAVTRDESGKLQVAKMPLLFGKAADEYKRAANQAYVSQLDPQIAGELAKIRVKYEGRPEEFKTAADAYVTQIANEQPTPELKNAATSIGARHAGENYTGVVVRQGTRAAETAKRDLATQQDAIENELVALARQGGERTPAFEGRLRDWDRLTQDRQANPIFGYSQAQADYDKTNFHAKLEANGHLSTVEQVYKDPRVDDTGQPVGGATAALKKAEELLTNDKLNLTQEQRYAYYHKATAEIHALEAARRRDLGEARKAAQDAMLAAGRGVQIDPDFEAGVLEQLRAHGGTADAVRFSAAMIRARQLDSFNKIPLAQQMGVVNYVERGSGAAASPEVRAAIAVAAEKTGVPAPYLFRVAGKESSFDPNAKPIDPATGKPTSSAEGLFQFTDRTWVDQLARNGQKYGLAAGAPKNDARANALMAAEFAKENAAALTAAGIDVTEKSLYLAHFAGAGGAKLLLAAKPDQTGAQVLPDAAAANQSLFFDKAGRPRLASEVVSRVTSGFADATTRMVAGPGTDVRLIAGMQKGLNTKARAAWASVDKDMDAGQRPADGVINQIVDAARITGDHDLLETIGARVDRFDGVQRATQQPLATQGATITELGRAGAEGALSPGQSAWKRDLEARHASITSGLSTNPIGTTIANFSDKFTTPGPLDTTNPAQFAAGLAYRSRVAQFGAENWRTPALPALDEGDRRLVAHALLQGNPAQAANMLAIMRTTLAPENLWPTVSDGPIKDALLAMTRSKDSAQMTAAFSMLDDLWRRDSWGFERAFKAETVEHLQAWHGLQGSFSAEEIAKRLNAADDPNLAKGREDAKTAAHTELANLTAADLAYLGGSANPLFNLATGWGRLTGSTPDQPPDLTRQRELVHDFSDTYTALRMYGVSADRAKELAKKRVLGDPGKTNGSWGVTAVGNQLMKYPPDNYYPALDRSHSWLTEALNDTVESIKGPRTTPDITGSDVAGVTMPRANWGVKGLIADPQTQAEIAAGKPPSYLIAIDTGQGMTEFLSDPKSGRNRFAFSPDEYRAKIEQRFSERAGAYRELLPANSGPLP